jgi:WD40 repeat protein
VGDIGLRVWSTSDWRLLIEEKQAGSLYDVLWLPDSSAVAAVGETDVYVWTVATSARRSFKVPADAISLALSPDTRSIATGGSDISVFSVQNGAKTASWAAGPSEPNVMAWTKEGDAIITAGDDGVGILDVRTGRWTPVLNDALDPAEFARELLALAKRCLTVDERENFGLDPVGPAWCPASPETP